MKMSGFESLQKLEFKGTRSRMERRDKRSGPSERPVCYRKDGTTDNGSSSFRFNIAFINEPLPFIRKEAIAFSIVGITALQNRYARCVHHFVEFSGSRQILLNAPHGAPSTGKPGTLAPGTLQV